jgi:hypothetical protein
MSPNGNKIDAQLSPPHFYMWYSWILCCFREHLVRELTWQMILPQGQRMLCRNKNRPCILKGLVNLGVSTTWVMAPVEGRWTANTTIQQTVSLGNRCVIAIKFRSFNCDALHCLWNDICDCCLWMQYDSTYHWTRPHLPLEQSCNHTVYRVNAIKCKVPCHIMSSDFLLGAVIHLILCAIFLCKFRATLDVANLILVCFAAFFCFQALQLTRVGMSDDWREEDLMKNKSLETVVFFHLQLVLASHVRSFRISAWARFMMFKRHLHLVSDFRLSAFYDV